MPRSIDLTTVEDILKEVDADSAIEKAKMKLIKDRLNERSTSITDGGHDINAMSVANIAESITVENILDQIRRGTLSKWVALTRGSLLGYLNLITGESK